MAEGHQRLAVTEALMNGDVPLRGDRLEDAYGLRRVRPCHMRQMTKGAAMAEALGGVVGGKRNCLERERSRNQQQNRKPPYARAVNCHRRLELYLG